MWQSTTWQREWNKNEINKLHNQMSRRTLTHTPQRDMQLKHHRRAHSTANFWALLSANILRLIFISTPIEFGVFWRGTISRHATNRFLFSVLLFHLREWNFNLIGLPLCIEFILENSTWTAATKMPLAWTRLLQKHTNIYFDKFY